MNTQTHYWFDLDFENRKKLLALYFSSEVTVNKHFQKEWADLPPHFKKYIMKQISIYIPNSLEELIKIKGDLK
jgi:hypothetical protein